MTEDQKEIRAEIEEQLNIRLLKVCPPGELEDFKEWIEENNYCLYHNEEWINIKTHKLVSIERLYGLYKNILRAV